jgi:hypothetical protein
VTRAIQGHVLQPTGVGVHPVAVAHAAETHVVFALQLFVDAHFASQLQDDPHAMPPEQPPPEQSTEQAPGPQITPFGHAFS